MKERLVWWKYPPKKGDDESDIEWGYVEIDEFGKAEFIDKRPSELEIRCRSSCLVRNMEKNKSSNRCNP